MVQNKFENLFGFSAKQSTGKNISIIIPQLVAKYHDLSLLNYVEKGSSIGKSTNENNNNLSQVKAAKETQDGSS